jgi:hypothetical protein
MLPERLTTAPQLKWNLASSDALQQAPQHTQADVSAKAVR